ncbi:hypothetical protein Q1695_012485 [Nippostrongylus brasiliensis]|nr:hypothetical protein Q1695_012485 [Nippostrongylus brasiliensis]
MIVADSSLPMQPVPDVLADAIASKELLQEQLRRQQAELEELRALRQMYEAQQEELRQWKNGRCARRRSRNEPSQRTSQVWSSSGRKAQNSWLR